MMPCLLCRSLRMSVPSASRVASTAPSSICVVSPTSPAFLAAVANAVQQVLLAQKVASIPAWSVPASKANSRGVSVLPADNSSQLATQCKLRSSPLLALVLHLLYRPQRLLLLQVGQITVLSLPLCRHFPLLFHRSHTQLFPAISTQLFNRAPLVPH